MKKTVVGLITPHVLQIVDLARQAQAGTNVDWHVRDAVAKTVAELGPLYNAQELLASFIMALETAAHDEGAARRIYARTLQLAAELARKESRIG